MPDYSTLTADSIARLDTQNMRGSISVFEQQFTDAWDRASQLPVPDYSTDTTHIACFAMGGSSLGMDVVRTACASRLAVPVSIINDYAIPASVNERTLVILSSYSGTTEETLAAAEQILSRTKRVVAITTGGALEVWAREHNVPVFVFQPTYNPSNQPRMAIGYSIGSMMAILNGTRVLNITAQDAADMVEGIRSAQTLCGSIDDTNPALAIATECNNRIPVLFSSEHLEGIVHVVTNQTNENGKAFAVRFALPEANHHLTEALVAPKNLSELTTFVLFSSTLYNPRTQLRYQLTEQLLQEKGFTVTTYHVHATTLFGQLGEVLTIGGWVSFYLAMLGNIDPSPIPNVDWFKAELKKATNL